MVSGRAAVEEAILGDAFLQEALARGIVNASAAARWLQENRGLKGARDALAHHLRQIQRNEEGSSLQQARQAASRAEIRSVSGRALVVLARHERVHEGLPELLEALEPGRRSPWIGTGPATLSLLVDAADVPTVEAAFADRHIEGVEDELTEIRIRAERGLPAGWIIGVVLEALAVHGVRVLQANAGQPFTFALVPTEDRVRATRTIRGTLTASTVP